MGQLRDGKVVHWSAFDWERRGGSNEREEGLTRVDKLVHPVVFKTTILLNIVKVLL
jgi:hypothetical protein